MKHSYKHSENSISLSDIFLKVMLVVFVLFFLAALRPPVENENKSNVTKTAEFIITSEWDRKIDCDVDMWIRNPNGKLIGFKIPQNDMMNIERDDVGFRNDTAKKWDGTVIENPENKEIATLRGFYPGEYVINIHLYSCASTSSAYGYSGSSYNIDEPIKVIVKLDKLNPTLKNIVTEEVLLLMPWQEKTAFEFTLDNKGEVTRVDRIPTKIVQADRGTL